MASRKGKRLNVYLNGDRIKVHDFRSYLSLFDGIPAPAARRPVVSHCTLIAVNCP